LKKSVSPGVVIAMVVVAVVAIAGIGYMLFAPHKESQADRDAYFAAHPEAKKAAEGMREMSQNTHGAPPPGVNISRRSSPTSGGSPTTGR